MIYIIFRYSDILSDDDEFKKWSKKWKKIEANEKLDHMQEFFRMFLSNDTTSCYYSFCDDSFADENCDWHCITCKKCLDWREWHCGNCNKCNYIFDIICRYMNYCKLCSRYIRCEFTMRTMWRKK